MNETAVEWPEMWMTVIRLPDGSREWVAWPPDEEDECTDES